MLTNLQTIFKSVESFFSNVESMGRPIEIENVVLIPIYTAFFGTGGGAGRSGKGEQENNGFGLGLGASKSPMALVTIAKNKSGIDGVHIHEFKRGKTSIGEALIEALPKMFEMWHVGSEPQLSSKEKEKLLNI